MSYIVMARKWRPALFEDVIAQNHVTITLQNAVISSRIAHAYMFSGPRGCGKTTTARILAKALNCESGPTPTPCNDCRPCKSIDLGNSPDVLEIDAASNRGIDEIRSLREKVILGLSKPTGKKVYIIDEVHMLTPEAFNALLKTLEEPPSHVIFILATTEQQKVPSTILSRCQRFNFRRIPSEDIANRLAATAEKEGIRIPEEALFLIARRADGAMRDAWSLLDQVVAYAGTSPAGDDVREALGILDQDIFFKTTEAIAKKDRVGGLNLIEELIGQGGDIGEFVRGLLEHLRNLLVCKIHGGSDSLDLSDAEKARTMACAEGFSQEDLLMMIQIVSDHEVAVDSVSQPRLHLELTMVKLIALESTVRIEELLGRLDRIETGLRGGIQVRGLRNPSSGNHQNGPGNPQSEPARPGGPGMDPEEKAVGSPSLPASDNPSLEVIEGAWGEIIDRTKKASMPLGVQLGVGTPCALVERCLHIGFPPTAAFQANQIKRNKQVLEDTIAEVIGTRLRVECRLGEPRNEDQGDFERADSREKRDLDISPPVQTVLEIFDGEILGRGAERPV